MHTGLYDATMGMLVDQAQVDMISNNLANVNTYGFKADSMTFAATMQRELYRENIPSKFSSIGKMTNAVVVSSVLPKMSEGALQQTGRKLDYAIDGNGFFAVREGNQILYTRDGSFNVSPNGELVDNMGREVLGAALQPIMADSGQMPAVFNVANPIYLQKVGGNAFVPTAQSGPFVLDPNGKVMQGYLETSNVNAVKEMVDLINAFQNYQIAQKAIMTQDSMMTTGINVGSVT
ncbi:MAG: flagellar basal-body rod protein FlgF [Mesoaciditoga sp.]|uniref:flagellar hook-basal body protein n=1 Tax=Athalassotoga sp. TaxID=2022597 RepID=UPI000CB7E77D|nr:MAG: flagellar basal-body rod protein FlgF [Mesoaciditoga sp.]HEU24961.1 flagellar hook-basal body protein [Mesoaciditoga lauensis]